MQVYKNMKIQKVLKLPGQEACYRVFIFFKSKNPNFHRTYEVKGRKIQKFWSYKIWNQE